MNVVVTAHYDRAIEVLATGLPLFFGAQLAVDITLRCALAADGTAHPRAARVDGVVCTRAPEDKETKYSKLLRGQMSPRCGCSRDGRKMERGPSVRGELGCRQPPGCSTCNVPLRQAGVADHALVPLPVRWWPCLLRCMPSAEPTGVMFLIWVPQERTLAKAVVGGVFIMCIGVLTGVKLIMSEVCQPHIWGSSLVASHSQSHWRLAPALVQIVSQWSLPLSVKT